MKEELLAYGLSAREADLYLATLQHEAATASALSATTGIRRSTVYEVLAAMKKKGLIASFRRDRKLHFSATDPAVLITRLQERSELIGHILPGLQALRAQPAGRPHIQLYEGKTGIRTATERMLQSTEILVYGASTAADRLFGSFTANFARRRAERKIMLRSIIGPDVPAHMREREVRGLTQIRTLPFLQGHDTVYFIYADSVLVCTLGAELFAMHIESPLLAQSQRQLFNYLWSRGKETR